MQKIMMPGKLWSDHAEGFESGMRGAGCRRMGTRFWNCVGRCSQVHSDDEYGTDFFRNSLRLGTYANSAGLRKALLQWCYPSRNFGANPTVSAGNGTSADDDRMQVDSLKKGKVKGKGKHQNQKGNRTTSTTNTSSTDINTCKNCGTNWTVGEGLLETRWRSVRKIPPVTTATRRKLRVTRKAKGKANTWTLWKRISLVKQLQPCRILHKHRVSLENSRAIQTWNRGSWV